jgi:hypothetical protein
MNSLQRIALLAKKKMVDDKISKLEADRLNAIQDELEERREAIDKEIAYLEDNLNQINSEIQTLSNPVVIDFSNAIETNSKNHSEAVKSSESYRQEIYDKESYAIGKMALLGLKIAVAMILASIIGKLSSNNPELVESLVAFTFFADMDNLGETLGLFLDFTSQEFILVFVISSALALIMRNEPYIHNSKIKYISIWIIIVSMVAIIFLSTL